MKLILALLALQATTMAFAQSANTPPAAGAKASAASAYLLNADKAALRCDKPGLVECIQMDEATCKSAMREAVKAANADIELEVAKEPVTPAREGFLRGFGAGRLLGNINKATNGKFIGCVMKK